MTTQTDNISIAPNGTVILTSPVSIMSVQGAEKKEFKKLSTKPVEPSPQIPDVQKWAPWGDNDDLPLKLLETISQIGVLGAGIDINASLHYGNGIIWGYDSFETEGKNKGKKIFIPVAIPQWEQLKKIIDLDIVQSDICDSLENFYIAFVECIIDISTNNPAEPIKLTSAQVLDPTYCRFERRDNQGNINHIYFDTRFGEENIDTPKSKIPIFNPANPTKHQKFVLPIQYRSWGKLYYPEQLYYACIRNGYSDIAISIPKTLKNIYKNQMTLKYIIRVPFVVMKRRYSNWDTPPNCDTPQQIADWQLARMKELQDEINTHLTSEEAAGMGIFTFTDEDNKGIEVEPIKQYLEASKELPTAATANAEILFALQLDPAITGLGIPGGKDLSGSGSDKRESLNIKQALLKRERLVSLKFPKLIANLLKFDTKVYPAYIDLDTSQTLDQNPTGKQQIKQG